MVCYIEVLVEKKVVLVELFKKAWWQSERHPTLFVFLALVKRSLLFGTNYQSFSFGAIGIMSHYVTLCQKIKNATAQPTLVLTKGTFSSQHDFLAKGTFLSYEGDVLWTNDSWLLTKGTFYLQDNGNVLPTTRNNNNLNHSGTLHRTSWSRTWTCWTSGFVNHCRLDQSL